ncbi:MAG: CDGSH iron-sulfur domain-containing protein, partial [Candidatus Methanomethylophilaceae archaeon]|nr:CDGSH iron-sulfur domain-containing protein [Candidatus Methanomethylophilaceae archaeon]
IRAACECPSGRIVVQDKDGNIIEDHLEPSIYIVQDPGNNVSSGIYVMCGIPLESSDGERYEIQNRMMLCRCGNSKNKPFCDASHISKMYKDTRGSISLFKRK